jgi:hypothetical protein
MEPVRGPAAICGMRNMLTRIRHLCDGKTIGSYDMTSGDHWGTIMAIVDQEWPCCRMTSTCACGTTAPRKSWAVIGRLLIWMSIWPHRANAPFAASRRLVPSKKPACYIGKDATGFAVVYVYFEGEAGRRAAANLMTQDEGRRIAVKSQGSDLPHGRRKDVTKENASAANPQPRQVGTVQQQSRRSIKAQKQTSFLNQDAIPGYRQK